MLKINDDMCNNLSLLVHSIVKKYGNQSNYDDLYQAGMLGALIASKKYDKSLNIKFTTYAYKYILGEILEYLRNDRNIRLSRDLISDNKRINRTIDYVYKTYGKRLSTYELSKILKMDEKRIIEILECSEKEVSLSKTINDSEITLEETIPYNDNNYLELNSALEGLNNLEKRLIYDRYYENKTQTEIAKENNMSQVKVYRYERTILNKLKDKMS